MADKQTEKKLGLSYARMLVEVNVGQKLPEEILFRNEKGSIISQFVTYDQKPSLCEHCNKNVHEKEDCRKLKSTKGKEVETLETSNKKKRPEKGKEPEQVTKRFERYQEKFKPVILQEQHPVKIANAFEQLSSKENLDPVRNVSKEVNKEPAPLGNG